MQKVPVCVDGRLDATAATGVARYSATVRAALKVAGRLPLTLDDAQRGQFGGRAGLGNIALRQARARLDRSLSLRREGSRLHARDVFRLAHARFFATGRLLELEVPGPAGIMHWTYPVPARIRGWANIYTVHDVIPLTHPGMSAVDSNSLRRRILAVAEHADRIITVSAWARREILEALPLDAGRVTDCGIALTGLEGALGVLPKDLVPQQYYLFCGLSEPRKNVPRLVAAWAASGTERALVLAGPGFDGIAPRPGLIVLRYQPREVLMALMREARALLFPSLAEGFGLPVAEAMALGTPVLTSDRGALVETAGGAALLVDPNDEAAIAAGIARLDRDDALCAALAKAGRERAQAFDIASFAQRLTALHAEVVGDLWGEV